MNSIFFTDADYVFNLVAAFPMRLCLSTEAEVREAIETLKNNGDTVEGGNGILVRNRSATAHLLRYEKAATHLVSLIRAGKVKKADVRRSKVHQELLKLLVRKRFQRPKQAAPKRGPHRKRIVRHHRPTEEVEEVSVADVLNEPIEIGNHPSNLSSMLDVQMDLEEESVPQLRVSNWGFTEFGEGLSGEVTSRPLQKHSSTPQL